MRVLVLMQFLVLSFSIVAQASEPGVVNFQTVVPGVLYRGGRPTLDQVKVLKDFGIHTVINFQGGDYKFPIKALIRKMEPGELPGAISAERNAFLDPSTNSRNEFELPTYRYFNFPLDSTGDITAFEDAEIKQTLDLLQDKANYPVFIHCEHGNDRTGLIAALYRIQVQGWDWREARKEWKALGHKGIGRFVTYALDEYFLDVVR